MPQPAARAVPRSDSAAAFDGDGRAALIMAHPGHELRIHAVLERVRPWTHVLTDGSGANRTGRVGSTSRVLAETGARRGEVYSPFTDVSFYAHLREQSFDDFCRLAGDLAESLLRHEIRAVIGDASDCYNPAHDVCRLLIDAAVQLVEQRSGRRLANYDFVLVGRPDAGIADLPAKPLCFELDAPELHRKLAASRGYPELAGEVTAALNQFGAEAFRREYLRPVTRLGCVAPAEGQTPYYETYGARRVAAGQYDEVIRYRTHLLPLAERLQRHVWEQSA